jgi:hypothetical protein
MLPNTKGVWRWRRTEDGREWDLPVFNVLEGCDENPYLRVYFLGSYYDADEMIKNGEWLCKVHNDPNGPITEQINPWVHPLDRS